MPYEDKIIYFTFITSVHMIHGAQHVVRCAREAADTQTTVGALIARVSPAEENKRSFVLREINVTL